MPDFGLDILRTGYNNATSLQFVQTDDGTVYLISTQQNGNITVSEVTFSGTGEDKTYSETIVFQTGIINTILNHNDDGTLATGVNGRQVTGFHAGLDENGDLELYVTSSDPRIGGGGEASVDETNLDTNSGVLSKVTIDIPDSGSEAWSATKIDLLRGLPRSEENHSVNGVDFTPDGKLLLMVGGFANAGAPSQNLGYTPEYFLSGTLLEIDVDALEDLPTLTDSEGQQYKYDLPTLGIQRGEVGDDRPNAGFSERADGLPWGGNDGYNQAYLEAGGPVEIFATGFRNGYDVEVVALEPGDIGYSTEEGADNFRVYVWDNGANNGWGEAPANAQGQVFATHPATGELAIHDDGQWKDIVVQPDGEIFIEENGITGVQVDTGNGPEFLAAERPDNIPLLENNDPITPGAQDNLHFVERGGYYGSPNLFHANPDAILYLKPELEGGGLDGAAVPAPEFTDENGEIVLSLRDFLPPELNGDPLNGFEPSPLSGFYIKPNKGGGPVDDALVLNNGSTNGIVIYEYLEGIHPEDMEIYDGDLFAVGFDEQIIHVDLSEDGRTALNRADIESNNAFQSSPGANPLDITIGPDGTIWVAAHGAGNIFAFVPGGEPVQETENDDEDLLFDAFDPFQLDPENGLGENSKVSAGEVFEFTMENEVGSPNGLDGFVLGLTGHMVNYTTEYFTNESGVFAGGVLDGGIAGRLQIEFDSVGDGTAEGASNDVTYALQAGVNFDDSSKRVLLESNITNVWTGLNNEPGQSQGIYFGTGTQFDFASFSFAINDAGEEVVRVYIELNDQQVFLEEYDATGMTDNIDEDLVMRVVIDREALTVQAVWEYVSDDGPVTGQSAVVDLSSFGENNLTEAIIGAGQGGFLARGAPENGERASPIFSNLQTDVFVNMGLAVGVTGRVEETNAEGGNLFTPEFDNLLITASDDEGDFAPVARDEIAGSVEFGETLVVDVADLLANDSSFEGGTLSITAVAADGAGTAELINGDTQVSYTPASANDTGFTYTVTDSVNGATSTAKADVDVTVPSIGGTVVYRVNAGSGTVTAVDGGPDWIGDNTPEGADFLTGDTASTFSNGLTNEETEMDLTNLPDPDSIPWQLFINERSDPPGNPASLEYTFDVDPGATYAVTVYYVENWQNIFTSPAQRIFDIAVNGEVPPELDGIHPLAEAAAALGVATPSGGLTDEQKQPFLGTAFARTVLVTPETGDLVLSFITQSQQPKVNAIEIRELAPPVVDGPLVSISDGVAMEGDGVFFTLDLSDTPDEPVEVTYEIVPGTAIPGVDYDIGSATPDENGVITGTATFAATSTDSSIVVNTIGNETFEGDRTFTVNLLSATGANALIETTTATGTILEDDPAPQGTVLFAINAGGTAPVDGAAYGLPGVTFDPDNTANLHPTLDLTGATTGNDGNNANDGGAGETFVNPDGTPFTGDTTLFETERWANNFGYNFDVPDGDYVIDLYFAEIFQGVQNTAGVGARVFDVSLEGEVVDDDLDLFDEGDGTTGNGAGLPLVPIIRSFNVTVTDGQLNLNLNSLAANGGADNAKISAIVVRSAGEPTPVPAEISIAAPADAVEAGDTGNTTLDFTVSFDKAPSEAVTVGYSVAVNGVTTVAFADIDLGTTGGVISVDVENDDAADGPENVVVTLLSTTADPEVAVLAATTSAAASVTEDDFDGVNPVDIDNDGILNTDDPFAYDGTNGDAKVLTAGGEFVQDFETDATNPFSAEVGFTGIVVNPIVDQAGSSATDPYGDRTTEGGVSVSGGTLQVDSSNTDLFGSGVGNAGGNNQIKDNYQSAADVTGVDTFEVVARTQNPFAGEGAPALTGFASFGITLGAGGVDDYIKFVLGGSGDGPRIQMAHENSLLAGTNGNKEENIIAATDAPPDNPAIDITQAPEIEFRLVVDKVAGTVQGLATFLDETGNEIGVISTTVRNIDPSGSFAAALDGENPLTGGDGGIAYGISVTDWGGAAGFTGIWDSLAIRALDPVAGDTLLSVSDAPAVLEAGDIGTTDLVFDITADSAVSGDVEVTYDVTDALGTNPVTETVTLTDGAGTITVPVANDDADNGPDSVSVTLTGVATAGFALGAPASATGSVTEDEFNTPFDEGVSGDISGDNLAPTDIKVALGDNLVTAAQQGNPDPTPDDRDFFTITIEEGQVLEAIILESVGLNDTAGFIGLFEGASADGDIETLENDPSVNPADEGVIGGYLYQATDQGTDILPSMTGIGAGFPLPLPAGTYTFWLNQNGPASDVTLNLQIAEVGSLAIADAPTIVEGGDDAADQLAFAITTTPATEGDVELTFDKTVDGVTTSENAIVTLDAAGQGTLLVDVAQDDADTGDTVVSITLTGTTSTAVTLDASASSATGTVTEDDVAGPPVGFGPGDDLDQDGTINSDDDDIDGDGALNGLETFRYDASNVGTVLAPGQSVRQEFDTDGTPFENGFTGALVRPNELPNDGGPEEVNLDNADVSDDALNITVTAGDHFGNGNGQQNAFVAAYSSENGLSVETRFEIPDYDPALEGDQAPGNFQSSGVVIGLDQNTLVKAVYGRDGAEFELAQDAVAGNGNGKGTTAGSTPAGAEEVAIRLEVYTDDEGNAAATAYYTFFDINGDVIGEPEQEIDTIALVNNPAQGNILKSLVESGAPLGAGVIQTSTGGESSPSFDVSYQYVEVAGLEAPEPDPVLVSVTDAPSVQETGDTGNTTVDFALQLSEAAEATVEINAEVSINGAAPVATTFTVEFDAAGAGILSVPVVNDDEDNDTDTVGLEILSITTPGFEVDAAAATASGEVTEDDTSIPPAGDVLFRVNVGGPEVATIDDGPAWTADEDDFEAPGNNNSPFLVANSTNAGETYDGNAGSAHPGPIVPDASVLANTPLAIFNTERSDPGPADDVDLTYEFPVEAGTTVEVRLFFAELFGGVDAAGERVMDVAVEGVVDEELNDIDQIAVAGPKGAFMRTVTVVVSEDGVLDIAAISELTNQRAALKAIEVIKIADPVDEAPTVDAGIAAQTTDEDALFSFEVPADAFADDGGVENLTLAASLADDTMLPEWLTFDPLTGTFSGTPENGDVATLSVKVTATDAAGQSVDALFDLTVNNTNDAPEIAAVDGTDLAATAGTDTVIDLAPLVSVTDVDLGDGFELVITPSDAAITVDGTTVTIPASLAAESYTISVSATDTAGATAPTPVVFALTVDPEPDTTAPTAVISPIATVTDTAAPIVVEVTYSDDVGLDSLTIDETDLALTGPGLGAPLAATSVSSLNDVSTYTFEAPAGGWSEGDFTVQLGDGVVTDASGNPVAPVSATATVDVPLPDIEVAITADQASVAEAVGAVAGFTVTLSEAVPAGETVEVNYTVGAAGDTASAGTDYVAQSGTLTFTEGQTSQPITVDLINDEITEAAETLSVEITGASLAGEALTVATATATTGIELETDNVGGTGDEEIPVQDSDEVVDVSSGGSDTITGASQSFDDVTIVGFDTDDTVSVTGASTATIVDVRQGSTIVGLDTTGDNQEDTTLVFEDLVDPTPDTPLGPEDFVAEFDAVNGVANVFFAPQVLTVSLLEAGALTISEELEDVFTLTVQLSKAATEETTVTFAITGDVTADVDYRAIPDTEVVFDVGEDTATILLEIFNDDDFEADEALNLTLVATSTGVIDTVAETFGLTITSEDPDTPVTSDPIVLEAEDFTGLGDSPFFAQGAGDASGNALIRLNEQDESTVSTELPEGVTPGVYTIAVTYFDESDGQSNASIAVGGETVGSWVWNNDGPGNAAQGENLRTIEFQNITIEEGDDFSLTGLRGDGEFVRVDLVTFTRTGDVAENLPPEGTDIPDLVGIDAGGDFTIPFSYSDPEGGLVNVTAAQSDGSALPDWLVLGADGLSGTVPEEETSRNFEITVTASDPEGLSITDTFTLTVNDVTPPEVVLVPTGPADPDSQIRVIVDFQDAGALDINSAQLDDFELEGPDGTFTPTGIVQNQLTLQIEAIFDAPLGGWTSGDYTASLVDGGLSDLGGNASLPSTPVVFAVVGNETDGPTASISTGGVAGNQEDLLITVSLADETGIDETSIDAADLILTDQDGAITPASSVVFDDTTNTATFTFTVPDGGFAPGEYAASLVEGAILDTLGNASLATGGDLLVIQDTSADVGRNLDEDLDDDGIVNSADADIDEDGAPNGLDRFAYDETDGDVALSDLGSINIDLEGLVTGDSPFKAGFTGVMPAFSATTVELDYATNNGAQVVETDNGNRLVVESSPTDTNEGEAAFTFGAKVDGDFTLSGTFDNPYFSGLENPETPANFEQYGLIVGIDGGTFVKFVTGSPGADFELSGKTNNIDGTNPPKTDPLTDQVSHAATKLDLSADVSETAVVFTGTWTTLDVDGNVLQTGSLEPLTLTSGPIFDAIQAGDTALAFGMTHTQTAGPADPFNVSLSELSLTDGDLDLDGPTASLVVEPVADTNSDIVVTATFADDTGIDPASLDGDEVVLTPVGETEAIPADDFVDNGDGTATYTFFAPDGGWPQSDFSVALAEGTVADTSPAANTNDAGTPVSFTIADPATPGANLDEDFDGDGILNNQDDDIDEDGITNAEDRFAYDQTNQGIDLPTEGSVVIDFEALEAGDSPFAAGFTGVNPTFAGIVQELDYSTNNGAQIVDTPNGKRLQVESSATDTNNASAAFTFGASVGEEFTFTGKFDNPYFESDKAPANSEQYGLIITTDGGDFLKLVAGSPGAAFELSGKVENVGFDGADLKVNPAGVTPTNYASVELTLDTLVTATSVIFTGSYTTFDAAGNVLSTGTIGTKTLTEGELFEAIQGTSGEVPGFGVTHTQVGGPNEAFTVSVESLSLTDGGIDTEGPTAMIVVDDIADGDSPIVVTVTFEDASGVDLETVDGDEIVVTSNGDDVVPAAQLTDNGDGSFTYTFAPPAGGWDGTAFSAALVAGTVADNGGIENDAGAPVEFGRNDVDPVEDILANLTGVDGDGDYTEGETGSVILTVMDGVNNVRSSNFGSNSFELTNTGDKQVAAVFIDVRGALYGDSVFDFDGSGGDTVAKAFVVNSETGDGTGAFFEGASSYFLPGEDPGDNTTGFTSPSVGADASGGFRGLLIKFDGSEGGFSAGELVGFSGDMDPNSLAAITKAAVDAGAIDGWDVGGISGAELIGSSFTVVFDDGTTAEGYLHSDGSLAGSVGEAVQGRAPSEVSVTVNGFTSDDTNATYGGTEPVIEVTGTPGDMVRVVMSQGFNPVTNPDGSPDSVADLVADRLEASQPESFQVSNALNFQTVDVVIGPDGTATVPINAFDYNAQPGNVDNPDIGTTPIAVTAAVIVDSSDPGVTEKAAAGPVAEPVYLTNPTGTPVTPAEPPEEPQKVFIAQNGTVVFEAESADFTGTSGWVFETTEEASNENPAPSGDGYIIWEGGNSFGDPAANSTLSYTFVTDEGGNWVVKGKFGRRNEPDTTEANDIFIRLVDSEGNPVDPVPQTQGGETVYHVKTGEVVTEDELASAGTRAVVNNPEKWMKFYIGGVGLDELNGGGQNGDNGGINVVYDLDPNETYTLQIAGRSNDFEVDKLAISNNGAGAATSAANNALESDFFITGPTEPEVDVPIDDLNVVQGNGVSFTIPDNAFDDADGDALVLTAPGLPAGFIFENGVLSAPDDLPVGSYPITIVATDDDQNSVSQTFDVVIAEQGVQQDFQAITLGPQDDIELGSSINSNDLETNLNVQVRLTVQDGVSNVTSVDSAIISWVSDRTHSGDATLTFQVEDTKEPSDFQANKDYLPVTVQAEISGTWQDEATIENVVDIADLINALIASQGPLNGGDVINLQFTGEGATRFIEHVSVTLDLTTSGGSVGGGNTPPVVDNALPDVDVQDGDGVSIDLSNVFSDADNDALTFSVSGLPNGVSLANGVISGSPTQTGTFTVSVTANDGQATATDVFELTVLPEGADTVPTVANPIADQEIETGEAFSFTVPGNVFDDADGDTLSVSVSAPAGFTVSGTTVSAPASLAAGVYPITVSALDEDGNTVSDTFNLAVTEPVETGDISFWLIDAETDQRLRVLEPEELILSSEFVDGVYNLEAVYNPGGEESVVFLIDGDEFRTENGDPYVMYSHSGADYNEVQLPEDGTQQSITVEVYSQNGGNGTLLASNTYDLTFSSGPIPNRAPEVSNAVADDEVALGAAVAIDVSDVFSDPDNDALTLQASGLPAGLSFNGTSITGTPTAAGTSTITVTASDGEFTTGDTFTLTVLPDVSTPPEVNVPIADQTISDDEAFSFIVPGNAFDDADGDDLSISISAPAGFSVTGPTVSAPAGLAPGDYDITVTATDDDQNAVSQTFTVTVNEAPPEPEGPVVLWLVDPETDQLIRPLSSNDVIGLNEVTDGEYNIAAIYTGPGEPQSARMFLDGDQLTVQNGLPYALFNDSNGDYNGEPLGDLGSSVVISAQIFDDGGGNGAVLGEVSVTVTFVAEGPTQNAAQAASEPTPELLTLASLDMTEDEFGMDGAATASLDVPVFDLPLAMSAGLEMQAVSEPSVGTLFAPMGMQGIVVDLGGGMAQAVADVWSQPESFDFAALDQSAGAGEAQIAQGISGVGGVIEADGFDFSALPQQDADTILNVMMDLSVADGIDLGWRGEDVSIGNSDLAPLFFEDLSFTALDHEAWSTVG